MIRILAATAALSLAATAALADPIEGLWRTPPDDNGNSGLIRVAPCGAALCGTLERAFGPDGAEVVPPPEVRRQILWDTVPAGDGSYRGRVYAPDREQEYASRLRLSGDRLSVSGCVLGLCREGGVWQRGE